MRTKKIIEAERDEFQDQIKRSVEQHKQEYYVHIKGVEFTMLPEVFNPNYAKPAMLLLDNLGVRYGDEVLDPFTGCGADAILAVLQGASRAVAIDKYPAAYECARKNVTNLGLQDKVDVRHGELFYPAVGLGEKFDLVVANPPFRNMRPDSNIEAAMKDEDYTTLIRFWEMMDFFLKPEGRVRCVFSDIGDVKYFEKLIEDHLFSKEVVAEDRWGASIGIKVYEARRK